MSRQGTATGHAPVAPTPARTDVRTPAVLFGRSHPLAGVAAALCRRLHGGRPRFQVACGVCWEQAIRDDERFVVQTDLPRELVPDPSHVDEIAVERACAGDPVALTATEFRTVVARLAAGGLDAGQIADRLSRRTCDVRRALIGPRQSRAAA